MTRCADADADADVHSAAKSVITWKLPSYTCFSLKTALPCPWYRPPALSPA